MLRWSYLLILLFCTGLAQTDTLFVEHHYDIRSDYAFVKYLPKRLQKFERLLQCASSLEQVQHALLQDTDQDSYFFAVRVKEPWVFVLATRGTLMLYKTAEQLQSEVFHDCTERWCSVQEVFKRFISAARKGTEFCLPFQWRWKLADELQNNVAYVELFDSKFGQLVLGVGMQVTRIPHHIILKNRIDALLRYLNKNGFDRLIKLINNDINPEGYAFVISMRYPYRWLAHGAKFDIVLKTPQEAQQLTDSHCSDEACDLIRRVDRELDIARQGGGYFAYLSRNAAYHIDELKISYIQPFWHKGNRYFVGTGYAPVDMPADLYKTLIREVYDALRMVNEIGLPNTLSVLNKKNTPDSYVFIEEMAPPYRPIAHGYRHILNSGYMALQQRVFESPFRFNAIHELQKDIDVAKKGGGFVLSLWKKDEPDTAIMLKVVFVKPLYIQDKSYVVGMGYLFD